MVETARKAGIVLGVVSQHRFDDASLFLAKAIAGGRLGKLLQADCYVKWYRSPEYYSRPIKGSWQTEGGGALINQAIHGVDILRWLAGPVKELFGVWQLGALHKIESEDVINTVIKFASGATGVIQASTAFWPGYTERTEFHGTKGTAIISGDKLTTWDVENDSGEPAPVAKEVASGASDPMAISLEPFERQFLDFGEAITKGRKPMVAGEEGVQAMEIVDAIYRSCRTGEKVRCRRYGDRPGGLSYKHVFDGVRQGAGHVEEFFVEVVVEAGVGIHRGLRLRGRLARCLEGAAHLAHGHQQHFQFVFVKSERFRHKITTRIQRPPPASARRWIARA